MSEYQYYEFLAIDRPLTERERSELREISTRAEITSTRFTNEYEWGDFKGNPAAMMERYFDAHLYFANWGTHRLMFRVPRAALNAETARKYFYADDEVSYTDDEITLTETDDHLVIDFHVQLESDDYWENTPDLGSMVQARSGLIAGDMRLLYLAWLLAVQYEAVDDEETEPPVPAGLASLSASLDAIVSFLEIDEDLIDVAAETSPDPDEEDQDEIAEWIAALPSQDKDRLLARVASGEGGHVQALLLRQFRDSASARSTSIGQAAPPRTAKELRDTAAAYKAEIAKAVQERMRAEDARREAEQAAAYAKHLDGLSAREAAAWQRAAALIATTNPDNYDQAVSLLRDLRSLAERDGALDAFTTRFLDLRRQHQRKPSLMRRFDAAGLPGAIPVPPDASK